MCARPQDECQKCCPPAMSVFRSSSSFLTSSCVHKQQLELKPKPNPLRLRTGQQSDFLVDVLRQIRMQDVRTGWTGYPQDIL
ncbi:GD20585 [Drosophila simulans]|uniref:GD20585 n=1 Tax=Drosophila simulans TaxID=7240 RepID=B4QSZ2_DROSI|nr:GD20585 [Drosophila simulans]